MLSLDQQQWPFVACLDGTSEIEIYPDVKYVFHDGGPIDRYVRKDHQDISTDAGDLGDCPVVLTGRQWIAELQEREADLDIFGMWKD